MIPKDLQAALDSEPDPARRMRLIDDALRPPEPQLLDTCVLQNLDWVDRQLEAKGEVVWNDEAVLALSSQYGSDLASDLIDLGTLYKTFEYLGSYPWLICAENLAEAARSCGDRGARLQDMVRFIEEHQEDLSRHSYPGVAVGMLDMESPAASPLILKALGIQEAGQLFGKSGPLSFLPDEGDRRISGYAILSNVPVILTTDRRTFWRHGSRLKELGLILMRPTELLDLYKPYWTVLSDEFERRRGENPKKPTLMRAPNE